MPRFIISPIAHSCASRLLVGAYRGSRTSDPMNLRRQAQRRRPPHRRGGTAPSSTPPSPRPRHASANSASRAIATAANAKSASASSIPSPSPSSPSLSTRRAASRTASNITRLASLSRALNFPRAAPSIPDAAADAYRRERLAEGGCPTRAPALLAFAADPSARSRRRLLHRLGSIAAPPQVVHIRSHTALVCASSASARGETMTTASRSKARRSPSGGSMASAMRSRASRGTTSLG